MADVIATQRGVFGKELREVGARFTIPDEIWNDKKLRPKWTRLHAGPSEASADSEDAKAKGKGRGRGKTIDAPSAEPFSDAGDPVYVKNEANDLTGATEPDWIAPGTQHKPVMAED